MRVKATEVKYKDLEPGDLFSLDGQEYWDEIGEVPGEKVYIRTEAPCLISQKEEPVYRIEVER